MSKNDELISKRIWVTVKKLKLKCAEDHLAIIRYKRAVVLKEFDYLKDQRK